MWGHGGESTITSASRVRPSRPKCSTRFRFKSLGVWNCSADVTNFQLVHKGANGIKNVTDCHRICKDLTQSMTMELKRLVWGPAYLRGQRGCIWGAARNGTHGGGGSTVKITKMTHSVLSKARQSWLSPRARESRPSADSRTIKKCHKFIVFELWKMREKIQKN